MNKESNKIDLLIRELKVSRSEFLEKVGVSYNTFANWRKREFGINVINKIVSAFPQVSYEWLITGEGSVLIDNGINTGNTKKSFNQKEIGERIKSLIEEFGYTVRRFAIAVNLDVSNTTKKYNGDIPWTVNDINKICDNLRIRKGWLLDGEGQKFKAPDEILDMVPAEPSRYKDKDYIPLIPASAMAGSLTGDNVQIMQYDIENYFLLPTFAKSDFCIRVEGNSMEPTYNKGDIIACKHVPMTGIWFQWGKVYVLATDQGVLVKHIEKGSDQEHVRLVSDNPAYQPFEIPISDIHNVAIINGLIRVE